MRRQGAGALGAMTGSAAGAAARGTVAAGAGPDCAKRPVDAKQGYDGVRQTMLTAGPRLALRVMNYASLLHFQKVLDHPMAALGKDALGVELHAFNRERTMAKSHDDGSLAG